MKTLIDLGGSHVSMQHIRRIGAVKETKKGAWGFMVDIGGATEFVSYFKDKKEAEEEHDRLVEHVNSWYCLFYRE